jgi:hypothetical protein
MAFRLKSPTEGGVIKEVQVLLVLNATFNNTYISVNIVVADLISELKKITLMQKCPLLCTVISIFVGSRKEHMCQSTVTCRFSWK